MSRKKFYFFYTVQALFFASLILALPFIHLHPELTHSDNIDEHTHPAIVHTLFSPEDVSSHPDSEGGIHFESSVELSRSTIAWNLFPQRFSSEPISGGSSSAVVSYLPFPLYAPESTVLAPEGRPAPPLSRVGSPPPSRAPPHPFFS